MGGSIAYSSTSLMAKEEDEYRIDGHNQPYYRYYRYPVSSLLLALEDMARLLSTPHLFVRNHR